MTAKTNDKSPRGRKSRAQSDVVPSKTNAAKEGRGKSKVRKSRTVEGTKHPRTPDQLSVDKVQSVQETLANYDYEGETSSRQKKTKLSGMVAPDLTMSVAQKAAQSLQDGANKFVFDDRIRFLLRTKRMEHGLSYQGLSDFLHVSWGTVRKWEQGGITTCHVSQLPLLRQFINGELDEEIHLARFSLKNSSYIPKLPREAKNCIEKFANTIYLCNNQPELREELLEYLDETSKTSLLWLVSPEQNSPDFSPDKLPR